MCSNTEGDCIQKKWRRCLKSRAGRGMKNPCVRSLTPTVSHPCPRRFSNSANMPVRRMPPVAGDELPGTRFMGGPEGGGTPHERDGAGAYTLGL